jgi:HAD superfamily hydrolase (TIGR01509 family)
MLELLRARGVEADDLHSFLARASLEEHESGRLHGRGLLERIASLTREPVSVDELYGHWVNMFELEPAMVELAHRLSEAHRVYLLSNIGDLHWAHLSREYRFHRIGHGALPSYLAGVMKPHEGIYAEAERRFALEPAATVFIDDRTDNIATARGRGWQGIVHGGYQSTVDALRGLEVAC